MGRDIERKGREREDEMKKNTFKTLSCDIFLEWEWIFLLTISKAKLFYDSFS